MPDDTTVIAQRFSAILTSRPCRRLDYWVGGMHVTGAGLATIARAITIGGKNGKGIGIKIAKISSGAEAGYDPATNEILIPGRDWASSDRFQRLALVHEGIHALRDLQGRSVTWNGKAYRPLSMTDEATAYLGGCLFDIYWQEECLGSVSENPLWLMQRKAAIHAVAYKVARDHANRTSGSAITLDELLLMNRTYRKSKRLVGVPVNSRFDNDGIPMPAGKRR